MIECDDRYWSRLISSIDHSILDRFTLQGIGSGLDLSYSPEAKDLHVWRPEKLFVVARVNEFVFN